MKSEWLEQKVELLHGAILLQLHAAQPMGLKRTHLMAGMVLAGFETLDHDNFEQQMEMLKGEALLEQHETDLHKERAVFSITEHGVAWLREVGFL